MRLNVSKANAARRKDITGQTFSLLTVVAYDEESKKWVCSCECGGTAKVRTAALNNGNTKSCGCYHRQRASTAAITLHKGRRVARGLSEEEYLSSESRRERAEFIPTSRKILERDNFCCVWCSQVGGKLAAHHIKPWMDNPTLRYEYTNLVTLCHTCHLKVHNWNYHSTVDPHMSILLEGYAREIEAICMRVELT